MNSSNFRKPSILIAATLLYAFGFVLVLWLKPGDPQSFKAFSNIAQLVAPIFAGCCAFYYASRMRKVGSSHIGWWLIGLGAISYAMGQVLFTYYDLQNIETFPSLADVGFAAAYPFLIAGVLLLFSFMLVSNRVRLLLDSAIAASSFGIISWYFLVEDLWAQSDVSMLGKLLSVFYPLADIVVLFSALVLLGGSFAQTGRRLPYAFLAGGAAVVALTDTIWNYYILNDLYQTGSWIDPGWPLGYLLIGYAPLLLHWSDEDQPTPQNQGFPFGYKPLQKGKGSGERTNDEVSERSLTAATLIRVLAPYVVALASWGIVAFYDYRDDTNISTSTFVAGFWLMFLAIVRQVLTMLENQYLTLQLQAFNSNLEHTVVKRTEQISSLYDLTKAVHNTLNAEMAISSALDYTQQAFHADAVTLCLPDEAASLFGSVEAAPHGILQQGLDEHPEIVEQLCAQKPERAPKVIPLSANSNDESAEKVEGFCLQAPLLWHNQILGSIGVVRWHEAFSPTETTMLESIGIEVAAAYKNAQIHAIAVETADRDAVTGLYNHRAAQGRLEEEIQRSERTNRPLTVVMMDLNNFKLFNDTYGHPVGDQVLKRVSAALESRCRKGDILARYGGDEFIAILPETDLPMAMVLAQRWRDRMALESFTVAGDKNDIPVSLSFGLAVFPHDSKNRHELVAVADANLYTAKISERGIVSTSDMQRQHRELRAESSFDVLDAMVAAVDNKDHYTRHHSEDVTEFALWIAEELGLSEETMRVIRLAGLLHDVGKIGVPESILRKPGRLTAEEFDIMKQHAQFGAYIVGGVPGMQKILPGVCAHHERWDGKGYPEGLAGEAIPFLGRLLAVADACSAMTTSRPYRKGLSWEDAMQEIEANIGTQFDPSMARAFLRAARRKRPSQEPNSPPVLQLLQNPKKSAARKEQNSDSPPDPLAANLSDSETPPRATGTL